MRDHAEHEFKADRVFGWHRRRTARHRPRPRCRGCGRQRTSGLRMGRAQQLCERPLARPRSAARLPPQTPQPQQLQSHCIERASLCALPDCTRNECHIITSWASRPRLRPACEAVTKPLLRGVQPRSPLSGRTVPRSECALHPRRLGQCVGYGDETKSRSRRQVARIRHAKPEGDPDHAPHGCSQY